MLCGAQKAKSPPALGRTQDDLMAASMSGRTLVDRLLLSMMTVSVNPVKGSTSEFVDASPSPFFGESSVSVGRVVLMNFTL